MAALFADIRFVLFDWGGTLCSVEAEEQAWRRSLAALLAAGRQEGLPLDEAHMDALVARVLATRARADADPEHREIELVPVLREWLAERGIADASPTALQRMHDAYWDNWVGCLRVIDGADRTLTTLRERGYRLGLVSNVTAPPLWCRRELERLGLWSLLDTATFSSEVGVRKPHRRIYQDALSKIAPVPNPAPERILFVGDSPRGDVAAPAALGLRTALVRDHADRWPAAHYPGVTPDLTVERVLDLLPHLPGPP